MYVIKYCTCDIWRRFRKVPDVRYNLRVTGGDALGLAIVILLDDGLDMFVGAWYLH